MAKTYTVVRWEAGSRTDYNVRSLKAAFEFVEASEKKRARRKVPSETDPIDGSYEIISNDVE